MRNEHDANLSLQPLRRAPARTVKRAPVPRPGVSLLACTLIVSLFAGAGVALALHFL